MFLVFTFCDIVFSFFFFFKQKTAYEMLRSLVGSEMCIRDSAMEVAAQLLPVELGRLSPCQLSAIRAGLQAWASEHGDMELQVDDSEELWRPLAMAHLHPLTHPAADAVADLHSGSKVADIRLKSELFWRCMVALHSMPLRQLEAMLPNRKDLEPFYAPGSASEHLRHFQRARTILPFFSMTCKTAEQIHLEATRKEAREAAKQEREQLELEQEVSEETTSQDKRISEETTSQDKKGGSKARSAAGHVYGDATTKRWESFDVDAALADLDIEEEEQATDEVQVTSGEEAELDAELKKKLKDPRIREQLRAVLGGDKDTAISDMFGPCDGEAKAPIIDLDAIIER
eukprot:TRINITY_DN6539_c0_g1_i1.p1 TRINITY_DN6539_c0_g1~~TRINITY_DN6539_c0_g1_i1.p1  ORF type:complete len:344 (-),score=90.04 TRINITY_DN6539_c0_g1_i1:237-1268(-)